MRSNSLCLRSHFALLEFLVKENDEKYIPKKITENKKDNLTASFPIISIT
jgi:hypothetical protein